MIRKQKKSRLKLPEDVRMEIARDLQNGKGNQTSKSRATKDLEQLIDIHEEGRNFLKAFKQKINYKDSKLNFKSSREQNNNSDLTGGSQTQNTVEQP